MCFPKIDDYLKVLTNDDVKDFVDINSGQYFEYTREKLYIKLNEEQNLRKVVASFYIFLTTPDEVTIYAEMMQPSSSDNCICHYNIKILNLFDPELQLINTKLIMKKK